MSSPHTVFVAVDPVAMYAHVRHVGQNILGTLGNSLLDDWDGDGPSKASNA